MDEKLFAYLRQEMKLDAQTSIIVVIRPVSEDAESEVHTSMSSDEDTADAIATLAWSMTEDE